LVQRAEALTLPVSVMRLHRTQQGNPKSSLVVAPDVMRQALLRVEPYHRVDFSLVRHLKI
jgi:hypothetical protein